MPKNKSSISSAASYSEMGEYWDSHSLADHWETTRPVRMHVNIEREVFYFPISNSLVTAIHALAKKKHVSSSLLVNKLLKQKLAEVSVKPL
jgi:hypothetical protein